MIIPILLAGALLQAAVPSVPEPVRLVREIQAALDRDGGSALERAWRAKLAAAPRSEHALLAVATLERSGYRYERADSLYRILDARGESLSPEWRAMAQLGMALWRALGSEPIRADSLFTAALNSARFAHLPAIESDALLGLAQLRVRAQGPKVGLALLEQWWSALAPPTARDSAQRLCLVGAVEEQLGDTTGTTRIRRGAAAAEHLAAWRIAGACRLASAQSLERRGYVAGAGPEARQALAHYARVRYTPGTALASQWYGYVEVQANRFAAGRRLLEQAIVAARATRFESVEAWAHSGLAELHLALGDLAQAREHAAIAASSHAARGDQWGVAVSLGFEAAALAASGDLPTASRRYADAHAAFTAAGLPLNGLPALAARALLQLRMGQLDSAERTIALASNLGRTTEGSRNELTVLRADVAMRRGQLALADSLLRSTPMSQAWRKHDYKLGNVVVAAREAQVALRRNRIVAADSALEALTNALDQWRRLPLNAGLTASLAQLRQSMGRLSDAYPDLVAQLASRGKPGAAFEMVEHIRAREIVERSLRSVALLRDTSAAARALKPDRDAAPVITLAEMQQALAVDEVFVSFTLGVDELPTTALIVTRDTVLSRSLATRTALLSDIERFTQLAAVGTESLAASRRLGAALLSPIFSTLPNRVTRVVLSLDGELHRLPFDALRLPDGRFAVERATFSTAPSATVLLALRGRDHFVGRQLVAFGDPRYATRRTDADERGTLLTRLRYSGDEARRVARYGISSTVRLDADASAPALRNMNWQNVGVLHIAAHAMVDAESQSRTRLALASNTSSDGFVTPGELAQLELRGPLVVLSACRSSGGQVLGGEGLRGLTAPLLEAGAHVVVATQWSIGDRSVLPFVDRFYAAMASGARVEDALRQAKLAAIRDGVSIADWGSFTIIGDGAMRVPLKPISLAPVAWQNGISQPRRDSSAR